MASLTMPTTPKASTARRDLSFGDAVKNGISKPVETSPIAQTTINVAGVVLDEIEDHDLDGRLTPVPGSNSSSIRTNTSSSPPSTAPPLTPGESNTATNTNMPAPTPDTARPFLSAPILTIPQAIHGYGSLAAEDQLKSALQSKDRIFVVMLSNEIEAFIARVQGGERPMEAQALPHAVYTQTNLSVLGDSVRVQSQATSKFQRMLVYKAAEWYGVKVVAGPEGTMYVGTMGPLQGKSAKLKLPTLVPERENKQQKFQIMQRRPASTSTSTAAANGTGTAGEGGPSSRKTLEQREAEYAQARERIFQGEEPSLPVDTADKERERERARGRRGEDDDLGPTASRFPRNFEPVFASLYHPPADNTNTVSQPPYDPNAYTQSHQGYYGTDGQYGMGYMPMPMNGHGHPQAYADPYGMGVGAMPMQYPPAQTYDAHGQPIMLVSNGMGGYVPWGPQGGLPVAGPASVAGVPPPQPGMNTMPQPMWGYGNPPIPNMPQQPPAHMQNHDQMSMQGPPQYPINAHGPPRMQTQTSTPTHSSFSSPTSVSSYSGYSNGPQNRQGSASYASGPGPGAHLAPGGPGLSPGNGQGLQHPKPQRPQPQHQHSYASSSISSRSYQDYSRPHSRGSTTSTRSATSSVRMGAMYPANQPYLGHQQFGPGYGVGNVNGQQQQQQQQQRQQGSGRPKGITREVNGLTSLNIGRERRPRGRSPSSTTTTSSRSSRRTNANSVPQYHPLPQRPDWTAVVGAQTPPSQTTVTSPSIGSTIPPSSPAQSDLASISVDGLARTDSGQPVESATTPSEVGETESTKLEVPVHVAAPAERPSPGSAEANASAEPGGVDGQTIDAPSAGSGKPKDPDFPARSASRNAQTLYNPSNSSKKSSSNAQQLSVDAAPRPTSAAARQIAVSSTEPPATASKVDQPIPVGDNGMTPEDVIEAKLRAISVNTGVDIGPPPVRTVSSTYAKAVRRE